MLRKELGPYHIVRSKAMVFQTTAAAPAAGEEVLMPQTPIIIRHRPQAHTLMSATPATMLSGFRHVSVS